MKEIVLFFCFLFPALGFSQNFEEELKAALKENPELDLRLDSRHSFINQTGVKVFGVKAGVQFDNKLSFGIGYNQLWNPLERSINIEGLTYKVELGFFNISPYVEYVFYKDNRWVLSIPVQFGFGSSFYKNKEEFGPDKFFSKFVVSYEPAITFEYRFLKYFGAGLGVGYRLMIIPNAQIREQFTSPVYIFKTNIYFEDIYRDIFEK